MSGCGYHVGMKLLLKIIFSALLSILISTLVCASEEQKWSAKLDSNINFYQTSELGLLLVSTEKSLYALDSESGEILWRRRNLKLSETDVAPIVGTDLLLLSIAKGERTRLEAIDLLSGNTIWQSDKIRGSIMQLAVDPASQLAAIVFVRDNKGHAQAGLRRHPVAHIFNLNDGDELWKYEIKSEVEMMPLRWPEKEDSDTLFTLDNYRPPLFLDGRLYFFYEGVTSFDARTGKSRIREEFRVNEDGYALTEADAVYDNNNIYISGHGRVRAISRATGKIIWEAKDLGFTPELLLTNDTIYARTGGRFMRLKDGEVVARGPYGVSALDLSNGKTRWRYRGADRGITNIALPDPATLFIADEDDLIVIDTTTGKQRMRFEHRISTASFLLVNGSGNAIIGGENEIASFNINNRDHQLWRARHNPPGRGLVRIIAAIAARAGAIYFRYGSTAATVFEGLQLAHAASALRWSGIAEHSSLLNPSDLITGAARKFTNGQLKSYGVLTSIESGRFTKIPKLPISQDIEDRLLDHLDPAKQLERLSRALLHRRRLASLRGYYMYFYTELPRVHGRGLAGVNINNGNTEREIKISDLDTRFVTDEAAGLLYSAKDERLIAYYMDTRAD